MNKIDWCDLTFALYFVQEDLAVALKSFFRVDKCGGKSLKRFDEVLQALDGDEPGPNVEWKKLFEEDREFNQGSFAECIRDQYLKERMEFIDSLGIALYEETASEDRCTREQVKRAILTVNPEFSEVSAAHESSRIFPEDVQYLENKLAMRRLSAGVLADTGFQDAAEPVEDKGPKSTNPGKHLKTDPKNGMPTAFWSIVRLFYA